MKTLHKLSQTFFKLATMPTVANVSEIVKTTVESLRKRPEMTGVLFPSNIEIQHNVDGDYFHVSFVLQLSQEPKYQEVLKLHYIERYNMLKGELEKVLNGSFGGGENVFKVDFAE